jgi:transposase
LHVLKTGCRWRDVPPEYGPSTTIYNRYNRWSRHGLWQRLFEQIAASGDTPYELSLDSSHVKAHRSAAGAKGGSGRKRSGARAGAAPRKSCLADDRGRPVAFALTPGNVADISTAVPLLGAVTSPKHLIADKAYDADSLRNWLKIRHIKAVIPSTATRTIPHPLDRALYRRRNLIERLFCRLKNWRRLAARYDRLARNYLAALALIAVVTEWI